MRIPIKKYVADELLPWEQRYGQLEKHHEEETSWMIEEIANLEYKLLNLLARIHRDGGHHTGKVGLEQSCKDADMAVSKLLVFGD